MALKTGSRLDAGIVIPEALKTCETKYQCNEGGNDRTLVETEVRHSCT